MKIKRVLISVSDKAGLKDFVKDLDRLGVDVISTGGTSKEIISAGVKVKEVADLTGSPEMLDGRVKTLHPRVHAGLLALRDDPEHMKQLSDKGIDPIDMVVVNLYPFKKIISKKDVTLEKAIENIDVGGPTMLRSAAKNYRHVAVVSSPAQYDGIINELKSNGGELSEETLKELAVSVFYLTSGYDAVITDFLGGDLGKGPSDEMPKRIEVKLERSARLRYGENPHQRAAYYSYSGGEACLPEKLQGKELSFNNIMDINAALTMVGDFEEPAVSIVKHNNPCGMASSDNIEEAFLGALDCDRLSAFGSIIGFNRIIDGCLAGKILEEADFIECIVAPDFIDGAEKAFSDKKNLRLLKSGTAGRSRSLGMDIKLLNDGALVQDRDLACVSREDIKWVTSARSSDDLLDSMLFSWKAVKHVKSNAIVLARGTKAVGIGAGQMSRVDSVIIAIRKAGDKAAGAVMASDAFFPKADSIEIAKKAGIVAIIQPGGSIRDEEVIEACNHLKLSMAFTGNRHFKH